MVERPSPTIRLGRIGRKFCPPPHLSAPPAHPLGFRTQVEFSCQSRTLHRSTAPRALPSKLAYDPLSALVRYTDSPTVDASARRDVCAATIATAGSAVAATGS